MSVTSDLYQDEGSNFILVITFGDQEDRIQLAADNLFDACVEADTWLSKYQSLYSA